VFTFLVAIVFKGVVLETVLGKEQSGTASGTRKHRWRNGTLRRLWGISSRAGGENDRPIAARVLGCPNLSARTRTGAQACCLVENRFGYLCFEI